VIDLSVIVVSWQTRDLTLECLAALETTLQCWHTTHAQRGQVLLVDNASTDGTASSVRERFPGVVVTSLARNLGFAAGVNAGLARAEGRHLLLLNSDARIDAASLARCVAVLDDEPRAGIVAPQLLHPDGGLQNSVHAFPSPAREGLPIWLREWLWPRRFPSKRFLAGRIRGGFADDDATSPAPPLDVEAVQGACLFIARDTIEKVGPLCDDYFFFLEETDWCWRVREAGARVLHVPDARAIHLSGASSKRHHPARTRIEFHRSLYLFVDRHHGPAAARRVATLRVMKCLGSLLLLSLPALVSARQRGRWGERARLLAWHLRGRPAAGGLAGLAG